MRKRLIIIFLSVCNICCYGQLILNSPEPADKKKMELCTAVINEVDAIGLRCDTIYLRPWDKDTISYEFKGIYFDENDRLRKYMWSLQINDGSNDHIDLEAYYDNDGALVYIGYTAWYHCGDYNGHFYVHEGRIVSYYYFENCECCEEEITEENMDVVRPRVGDTLEKDFDTSQSFKSFLYARTLLEILKNEDYGNGDEYI